MIRRLSLAIAALSAAVVFAEDAVVLQRGKPIERELAGGQEHFYRVPMGDGEYAGLSVEQRGIDVVVQVLSTDGKPIADFDSEITPQGSESLGLVAGTAGSYTLRIKARYPKADAARYEIRLVEVRPAVERDRAAFEAHKLGTEARRLEDGGKFDEAIRADERASDLAAKALGADDPYIASLLVELSSLKRRATMPQPNGPTRAPSLSNRWRSAESTRRLQRPCAAWACFTSTRMNTRRLSRCSRKRSGLRRRPWGPNTRP